MRKRRERAVRTIPTNQPTRLHRCHRRSVCRRRLPQVNGAARKMMLVTTTGMCGQRRGVALSARGASETWCRRHALAVAASAVTRTPPRTFSQKTMPIAAACVARHRGGGTGATAGGKGERELAKGVGRGTARAGSRHRKHSGRMVRSLSLF